MNCPVCKNITLQNEDLLENLHAKNCQQCKGYWIPSYQYWKWLDKQGDILPEKPTEEAQVLPVDDSKAGKLCPECGHFLTQKKVGHDVNFKLDRCNHCGGIWFDHNEWEILQSRNLHDEVHFIFSAAWQKQIKDEENKETHEERIKKIIGGNDYNKLRDINEWICSHPQKNTILSYIMGNNS